MTTDPYDALLLRWNACVRNAMNRLNAEEASNGLISTEYSGRIFDAIEAEVAGDVAASAGTFFNDDDVRLAVGRVLLKRLGIDE